MVKVVDEIRANYLAFSNNASNSIVANIATFRGDERLAESYARVAAINAPKGPANFFFEAHNDALLSHVSASFGSWRPALQALRSFLENTMAAIYFLDHPIEFQKWGAGSFFIPAKDLREYIADHPKLTKVTKDLNFRAALDKEYSPLSKAVHGSSALFRMTTADGKTNIASPIASDLGKWSARERCTVDICMTALVGILSEHLDGAKMQNLRSVLGIAIQPKSRNALKNHLSVSIPAP